MNLLQEVGVSIELGSDGGMGQWGIAWDFDGVELLEELERYFSLCPRVDKN